MIKLRSLLGLLVLLLLMSLSWLYFSYQAFLQQPITLNEPLEYDINRGSGAFSVASELVSESILKDSYWIKVYLRLNQEQTKIRAGRYLIEPGMNVVQLFQLFSRGEQVEYQITLVEGLTFEQVYQSILSHPEIIITSRGMDREALLSAINAQFRHEEGILFADTYSFHYGYTDIELLKRAHQRLLTVLNQEWESRAQNLPYQSPYEALIMASIIEKETAVPSERDRIAGVFVRRIEKNMRLQTDPTVIYGIGEQYDGNITRKHLKTDTPYNTYTRRGLPPSPIAIVGRESIHAALHPAAGSELYFVAKGDGSHQFSDTLEQHNKAVRKYQLGK